MTGYKLTTLDNGLRIVSDFVPSVETAALGIWIGTGARNETADQNGITHFIEHMLFKGTKSRSAFDISREIENVGGNMNAYTSRELTSYHVHVLKDDIALGAEILSDMVMHSTFPDDEIERERDVILQEIGMCADTPDDLVFDEYFETAYADQSLGAPILGRKEILESLSKDDLKDHIQNYYLSTNTVISAAGNIDHDALCGYFESHFGSLERKTMPHAQASNYSGGDHRHEKELEQSHVLLGFEALSRRDEDFYVMHALSSVLGGGMSSRLFQEVREKRGLVYSVYSFFSPFSDSGQFAIYAGTGPERLPELMPVLCDELNKMRQDEISAEELSRVKAQLKSQLLMGRESMMNRADCQAKQLLLQDGITELTERTAKIDAITGNDIQNLAQKVLACRPTLSALGPLSGLESYEKIAARMSA